jgi:hypothetical protein
MGQSRCRSRGPLGSVSLQVVPAGPTIIDARLAVTARAFSLAITFK